MSASGVRRGFNPYVHGARGLFSVMVFVFHVANSGWSGFAVPAADVIHWAMIALQYGVELFFGISGFVIIGALERSPSLALFAWDRFTRIYPVLWTTIAAIVVVALLTNQPLPSPSIVALNVMVPPPFVTIVPMNPPAWSLSWEISFYALCAVGFVLRRSRLAVVVLVAGGLVVVAIFPRTMLMLPGLLVATGRMRFPPVRLLSRYPALCLTGFLFAWHGLGLLAGGGPNRISPAIMPIGEWLAYLPGVIAVAVLGTAALVGTVEGIGWFGRILAGPIMRWFGTISYSFYLWHPIALHAAKIGLHAVVPAIQFSPFGQLALVICGFPLAIMLGSLSQTVIEVHLTRWLRQSVGGTRRAATVMTADPGKTVESDGCGATPAGSDRPVTAGATS